MLVAVYRSVESGTCICLPRKLMIVTKLLSDDDLHVLCLCSVRRFLTPLEKLSKPR